jgi:hypothetical protein
MAGDSSWTQSAEGAIRTLRDIEGVNIRAEGDDVREIHVLTSSLRPAKQIVRDVQTLLLTRFHRTIDHRVVSVAFANPVERPAPAPRPPTPTIAAVTAVTADERIRYTSANLIVTGPRAQASVELRWRGTPRAGSASGWSTRKGGHRLIASAALAAVQEMIDPDTALSLEDVEVIRLAGREVAVVSLELLADREHKSLVGSCVVEQDAAQAVVLATLNALNRIVGSFGASGGETNGSPLRPAST